MIPGLIAGVRNQQTRHWVGHELGRSGICPIDITIEVLSLKKGDYQKLPEEVVVLTELLRYMMMNILNSRWCGRDSGVGNLGGSLGTILRTGIYWSSHRRGSLNWL
jgi:hypothetical protein